MGVPGWKEQRSAVLWFERPLKLSGAPKGGK
jgi:hypothetical protein